MRSGAQLSAEIAAAELRVQERRWALRVRRTALSRSVRRRLISPVALLAAAGAGLILGSRTGRRGLLKAFPLLKLVFGALSAIKA